MKKTALFFLFILLLISLSPERTFAVAASPYPVQVVQPDGSAITIRIHGDEFLNWATCGERLVSRGSDGFFYYADFKADGSKELSGIRAVYNNIALLDQTLTSVRPPAAAIEKARLARAAAQATLIRTKANDEFVKDPEPFATGSGTFLVILVEFQDTKFTTASPQQAFFNLLNQNGYNVNGATGSAKDYYFDNSRGDFDPQFVVAGPVTAKYNSAYYSGDDGTSYVKDLVVEATNAVNSQVNFAQFDHDGDNYVDNIFIFFAGRGQNDSEDPTTIWPHAWSLDSPYPNLDGKRVYRYACASELKTNKADYTTRFTGIGTFCHEFGHVLGLPDFYDTDYKKNGQANGLGYYSLMDTGNYSNNGNTPPYLTCMERYLLDWMTESDITSLGTSGFYQLAPVQNDVAYTSSTSTSGDYYLYENRQQTGWDAYIPGHGLMIYHVDTTLQYVSRWSNNKVNAYSDHECFDLIGDAPFPGTSGKTAFTSSTTPAAEDWKNNATGYNLSNITETGTTISFTMGNTRLLAYHSILNAKDTYTVGERYTFSLMKNAAPSDPASVNWYFDNTPKDALDRITLTGGTHTVKAVLSFSNGTQETIVQEIYVE